MLKPDNSRKRVYLFQESRYLPAATIFRKLKNYSLTAPDDREKRKACRIKNIPKNKAI